MEVEAIAQRYHVLPGAVIDDGARLIRHYRTVNHIEGLTTAARPVVAAEADYEPVDEETLAELARFRSHEAVS